MVSEKPQEKFKNSATKENITPVLGSEKIESGLEVGFAKEYLETTAGIGYYEGINLGTPESLVMTRAKLDSLKKFLPHAKDILSIGVGTGEELHAIVELYKDEKTVIHVLDLSPKSLSTAKERLARYGLKLDLIEGSALGLPFNDHSVDGIIESAILHEVYSYVPDGKNAWRKAIAEVALKLSENGIYLLRDFSAPASGGEVCINLTSDFARRFYDYFREYYRTFSSCSEEDVKNIVDKRIPNDSNFPKYDLQSHMVTLLHGMVAEFILHFRNFFDNYSKGMTTFGDSHWKEINESYLLPNPNLLGVHVMSRDEYVETVLIEANNALKNTEYEMVCIQNESSARPETTIFLEDHFMLSIKNSDKTNNDLLSEITQKMELVFKKKKKNVEL